MLEIIRPLLAQQDKTYAALSQLGQAGSQSMRLGLTTAFEQGVFASLEMQLEAQVTTLNIVRHGYRNCASGASRKVGCGAGGVAGD